MVGLAIDEAQTPNIFQSLADSVPKRRQLVQFEENAARAGRPRAANAILAIS
jgi:hypothetical protein